MLHTIGRHCRTAPSLIWTGTGEPPHVHGVRPNHLHLKTCLNRSYQQNQSHSEDAHGRVHPPLPLPHTSASHGSPCRRYLSLELSSSSSSSSPSSSSSSSSSSSPSPTSSSSESSTSSSSSPSPSLSNRNHGSNTNDDDDHVSDFETRGTMLGLSACRDVYIPSISLLAYAVPHMSQSQYSW